MKPDIKQACIRASELSKIYKPGLANYKAGKEYGFTASEIGRCRNYLKGKKVPKVEKISDNEYKYDCQCGKTIILVSDVKPDKLIKCFECIKKESDVIYEND